MWAAVSHELQYKRESSVPIPVRRSIHRVSALLETIDLEFSRVIEERSQYLEKTKNEPDSDRPLDVETLKSILDETLPPERKLGSEGFDGLLKDVQGLKRDSSRWLRDIIMKNLEKAQETEQELMQTRTDLLPHVRERGFIWNQTGLVRQCLIEELGESTDRGIIANRTSPKPKKTPAKPGPNRIRKRKTSTDV
jgi:hypothetical protein